MPKSTSVPLDAKETAVELDVAFLSIEAVLDGAGADAVSYPLAVAPNPTLSTILASVGFAPLKEVVVLTNATFPAVPLNARVPVTSGVGKLAVPPVPAASCIKKKP